MSFVRFVIEEKDPNSGGRQGLFQALATLEDRGELLSEDHDTYARTSKWFEQNLNEPRRFVRSSNPSAKRIAISWFKDTATRHIDAMRTLAGIAEAHGLTVRMIATDRPGYVVYEDEFQVTAVPFRDTGA